MKTTRNHWATVLAAAALALSAAQAHARPAVVKVSLWDRGAMSMAMLGHGPMMGVEAGHMANGPMGITVSTATVPAGEVTFRVTNDSTTMEHEMVVSPVKGDRTPLPYDQARQKVDEDAAGHLGEVAELAHGEKGSLTLKLKPGRYVLYCNVAGHYALGMWTVITAR